MTRARPAVVSERGFALLGAVMFTLVLTILALSLFSLSGFESQFMNDSIDRAKAYHAALGGLERARFALANTGILASVKNALPLDSVTYAVARQNADSTDQIQFTGPNAAAILVRVMAQWNGERRFLEAQYAPSGSRSFYRNLMTLSSSDTGLFVHRRDWRDPPEPPDPWEENWKATYLEGEVWQNALNNPDVIFPLGDPPHYVSPPSLRFGGVPDPVVSGYITQHSLAPGTIDVPKQPGSDPYVLNALGDPDSIAFFHTPGPDGAWSLDMGNIPQPRIKVSGTVLWLLDQGLRVERTLQVEGSGRPQPNNDMLVIVGGPQTGVLTDPDAGIALLGSINSPNVPVILVSDGNVLIEHRDFGGSYPDDNYPSQIGCLSIFGRSARIMGPDANYDYVTGSKLVFSHPENHPANAIINRLADLEYLPNTAGSLGGKLSLVSGTWREVTEPNPN